MATTSNNEERKAEFARLVSEAPTAAEAAMPTVSLTGLILRSDKEGMFLLGFSGGQTVELKSDAVRRFSVVHESGNQRVVQVEVPAASLTPDALVMAHQSALSSFNPMHATMPAVGSSDPTFAGGDQLATHFFFITSPTGSSIPGGAMGSTPFVLAIPHHAPQAILIQQVGLAPSAANTPSGMTDPGTIQPFALTEALLDTVKKP